MRARHAIAACVTLAGVAVAAGALAKRTSDSPSRAAQARDGRVVLRTPGPRRVLLRKGTFRMGSTIPEVATAQAMCRIEPLGRECKATTFADEMVAHDVTLDDFWIDRTEVTNEAYHRCVDVGVCRPPAYAGAKAWTADPRKPVTLVSWYDAQTFCRWDRSRLPTEAEWERAAKGWKGRTYPWGEVWNPKICNHGRFAINQLDDIDGFAELAPVGAFPQGRSREGIDDLAGNVEEWVADWYSPGYPEADVVNPTGPSTGDEKVLRGGSYVDGRGWLRTSSRSKSLPSLKRPYRGFRCARDHKVKRR